MKVYKMITYDQVLEYHRLIQVSIKDSIDKAVLIVEHLVDLKSNKKHGEWTKWVEDHMPFCLGTTRNYIRLFENKDKL